MRYIPLTSHAFLASCNCCVNLTREFINTQQILRGGDCSIMLQSTGDDLSRQCITLHQQFNTFNSLTIHVLLLHPNTRSANNSCVIYAL